MTKLITLFPGGDQPIQCSDEVWCQDDEDQTISEALEPVFPNDSLRGTSARTISLSQPTPSMTTPLEVQVDPVRKLFLDHICFYNFIKPLFVISSTVLIYKKKKLRSLDLLCLKCILKKQFHTKYDLDKIVIE